MVSETSRIRRGGGRAARRARRTSEVPEADPCPPGPRGGAYAPLGEGDLKAVYDTALRLLDEIGMAETPPSSKKTAYRSNASGHCSSGTSRHLG